MSLPPTAFSCDPPGWQPPLFPWRYLRPIQAATFLAYSLHPSPGVISSPCSVGNNTATFTLTTKAASGQFSPGDQQKTVGNPPRRRSNEFAAIWEAGWFSKDYKYWLNNSKVSLYRQLLSWLNSLSSPSRLSPEFSSRPQFTCGHRQLQFIDHKIQ